MKLCLQITAPPGISTRFEHAGPIIRIGRDSECELALEGDAAKSVSSRHAEIRLTPQGATLIDTNSSNGTLLNDRPVKERVPVRVGDLIQLGYTGATLKVIELKLTAPAPITVAPLPSRRPLWIIAIGAGLAAVVLGGVALALILGRLRSTQGVVTTQVVLGPTGPETSPQPTHKNEDKTTSVATSRKIDKPVIKPAVVAVPDPKAPALGQYVALPDWGRSVLLQRRSEAYPWTFLRPEEKVFAGNTLISLPGYRSRVNLDRGITLVLWGNLPQFSSFPPIQESMVQLNTPEKGMDLDLTLNRGRVHVANSKKPGGPVIVRLRFLDDVWDVTLPEPNAEMCVEHCNLLQPGASAKDRPTSVARVFLFTKGKARLKAAQGQVDLPERSRVVWVGKTMAPQVNSIPELPDWWKETPSRKEPKAADVMLSLQDWNDRLTNPPIQANSTSDLLDAVRNIVFESPRIEGASDVTYRVLGIRFLAALDGAAYLPEFLEDKEDPQVMAAAADGLRTWLERDPGNEAELLRFLPQRPGISKTMAVRIVQLLHPYSEEALNQPETYQSLLDDLESTTVVVRHLAHRWLAGLLPKAAETIAFDPKEDLEKRKEKVMKWRMRVPKGTVPRVQDQR